MGELIQFQRPDGAQASGYLAEPTRASAPGVVVIQEYWGLNAQIKSVADRLATAGYRALVPDLYKGKLAANAEEAGALMQALDWSEAVGQDLRGAAQHLAAGGAKVAALGFCMGGAVTLAGAIHVPELAAAVVYYGIPSGQDPSQVKVPLLCHFAQRDEWCTPAAVDALEAAFKKGRVPYALHRYEASHAFCNDRRPEVYAPELAKLAWERSLDFLGRQLG